MPREIKEPTISWSASAAAILMLAASADAVPVEKSPGNLSLEAEVSSASAQSQRLTGEALYDTIVKLSNDYIHSKEADLEGTYIYNFRYKGNDYMVRAALYMNKDGSPSHHSFEFIEVNPHEHRARFLVQWTPVPGQVWEVPHYDMHEFFYDGHDFPVDYIGLWFGRKLEDRMSILTARNFFYEIGDILKNLLKH